MTTPATHADLRAALEFYATYWCGENNATPSASLLHDMGERARKALAALALPADEVRLRVRWEDACDEQIRLFIGPLLAGEIYFANERRGWVTVPRWSGLRTNHPNRDAAREALVKAVGGEG